MRPGFYYADIWKIIYNYSQISNIIPTLVGNKRVDHSCSWSIACSNYIFILDLTPGFNGLGKDNCETGREVLGFGASNIRYFTVIKISDFNYLTRNFDLRIS